tara:strand:+ start:99 stop:605 length:507 start_codon:yes stop_codon:yes gene_type:complete
MKNLLWIVVAAVVVGGGYMLYSGSSPKELMDTVTDVVNAPAALEAASNAVGDAVDATEGAVDGAVDAASDATASSAEAATTEAATDTAAAADETATDAVAGTAEAASGGMADLLSVDGFDLDKVSEMIDGSEIGAFQKTALKTALEKAKDNPEVLQTVLDKIKEAAGL